MHSSIVFLEVRSQLISELVHLLLQGRLDSFARWLGVVAWHLLSFRRVVLFAAGRPAHEDDRLRVVDDARGQVLLDFVIDLCTAVVVFVCQVLRSKTGTHEVAAELNLYLLVLPVRRRARGRVHHHRLLLFLCRL